MGGVKKVNCENCGKVIEASIDDVRKKYYCNQECRMKGLKSKFTETRSKKKAPKTQSSFKSLKKIGKCKSCS